MSRPYIEFVHPDDVAPTPTLAVAGALPEGSSRAVDFENRYGTKDGRWCWLLWSAYSDRRQSYLVAKDITERKPLEAEREELLERVEAMARTDALTGLPNRRSWEKELRCEVARARRQGHALVVVMLDLDRFKDFNDAHGHHAGDRRLAHAAAGERLRRGLRRRGVRRAAPFLPARRGDRGVERMRLAIPDGQTCSPGAANGTRRKARRR